VLDEHEEGALVVVGEVVLDDVAGLAHGHHYDLFLDLLQFGNSDDADGVESVGVCDAAGLVDLADAALAQLVQELKVLRGFVFEDLNGLKAMLELAGAQQLSFELAFLDLVAVVGDDIEHSVGIYRFRED
jgi:hypothetical protein